MEPIWAVDLVYTYIYYRWKKEKKSRILFWRVMMMRAGSTQCPLILFLQQWHSLFVYNARTLNRSSSVHLFHSILFSHFRQSSESFSLLLQSHPLFRVSFIYKKRRICNGRWWQTWSIIVTLIEEFLIFRWLITLRVLEQVFVTIIIKRLVSFSSHSVGNIYRSKAAAAGISRQLHTKKDFSIKFWLTSLEMHWKAFFLQAPFC